MVNHWYPQNQTFAHAHIISHFCHGVNSSLIQIHRDSLHFSIIFIIGSMMSHFSHDVPYAYIESKCEILLVICSSVMLHHYRRIYIYIYATPPQTIRIMNILWYIFFHQITSSQKDIYVYNYIYIYGTPQNNTYKDLPMDILLLLLLYIVLPSYYIITEGYIYIYIYATTQNNTYKDLPMDILLC